MVEMGDTMPQLSIPPVPPKHVLILAVFTPGDLYHHLQILAREHNFLLDAVFDLASNLTIL